MTTSTFNPWPFTVSVDATGLATTRSVPNSSGQATKLDNVDVGSLLWESLVRNNVRQAAILRNEVQA